MLSIFLNNQRYLAGLYRCNLNDRFALRLNVGFLEIKGSNTLLDNTGIEFPEDFHDKVKDLSGIVEFNL